MMTAIERFIDCFANRLSVLEYREHNGATIFSALVDEPTAIVYFLGFPPYEHNAMQLQLVGINPKLQKHGYGGMLLRELTKWADAEQVALYGTPELCDLSGFDFTADGYRGLSDKERIGYPYGNEANNLEWAKYLISKHGFQHTGDGFELRRLPRKSE